MATLTVLTKHKYTHIGNILKRILFLGISSMLVFGLNMYSILEIIGIIVMVYSAFNLLSSFIQLLVTLNEIRNYKAKEDKRSVDDMFADLEELLRKQRAQQSQYQRQYRQHQERTVVNTTAVTNAYKLLKVSKSDEVSVIKKSYRTFAKQWHPDKFTNDTAENQETSKRNIQRLNNAYALIKKDKNFN